MDEIPELSDKTKALLEEMTQFAYSQGKADASDKRPLSPQCPIQKEYQWYFLFTSTELWAWFVTTPALLLTIWLPLYIPYAMTGGDNALAPISTQMFLYTNNFAGVLTMIIAINVCHMFIVGLTFRAKDRLKGNASFDFGSRYALWNQRFWMTYNDYLSPIGIFPFIFARCTLFCQALMMVFRLSIILPVRLLQAIFTLYRLPPERYFRYNKLMLTDITALNREPDEYTKL